MAPNPQTSFHLPPRLPLLAKKRVSKFFKRSLRALVKYLAFPFGLYKPRNNINDLDDPATTLVELPDGFMVEENFLWDGVHLSPIGHQRCAELIRSQLSLAD